ncbi:MAG: N-acetylmuramoyl-L-alanine amidase, partial [Actinomycetota bacterium]
MTGWIRGLSEWWGRRWLRFLVGVVVVASVVLVVEGDAAAVRVPVTLADRRPVGVGPVETGFPVDYLGVVWETGGLSAFSGWGGLSGEPHGAVRFGHDGLWGPWVPLVGDDLQVPGGWGSSLVPGGDADAYQVRGVPWGAVSPRVVVINTTDGPLVTVGQRPSGVSALADCLSRAEWGADESLRFTGGVEDWPAAFEPVRVMTVHHTATVNSDPDPAATVRAIYVYHTVDRGWGDIAYQYLIDEAGRVYEGRWSGGESVPCGEGGDGSDFGHDETAGELVTGGHVYCYNRGNLGVALLGDFTRVEPRPAARAALESALAENAIRHGLDPLGMVFYEAPNDVEACADTVDAYIEVIAAHTDWPDPAGATACPGSTFYP